jgi:hypothetical protein
MLDKNVQEKVFKLVVSSQTLNVLPIVWQKSATQTVRMAVDMALNQRIELEGNSRKSFRQLQNGTLKHS